MWLQGAFLMWFNTAPVTCCKKARSEIRGLARFFYLAHD